jgi:subtilisin family serine protease
VRPSGTHRLARRAALLGALGASLLGAAPALATPAKTIVGVTPAADVSGRAIGPRIESVRADAASLRDQSGVRYAEPNHTFRAAALPADRLFTQQWALSTLNGVGAAGSWFSSAGAGVTIAVLDSGVDLSHPDLAANLWTNTREVPANGVDDDANGYVDDVHGADMLTRSGNPQDHFGHGTAVAGIAAARGGNGIGISGVAPRARIMPVKVLADNGAGSTESVVAGLYYAVHQGAKVVNLSVNGPDHSIALDEAIRSAEAAGVIVVASAGNDGANRDQQASYPASSASPNIVTVAAGSEDRGLTPFSAWGRGSVDLSAPGADVLSTSVGGGYAISSGTSEAAPHVAGALAVLLSARPGSTPAQLRAALLNGTSPMRHDAARVAAGRLDVTRALRRLAPGTGPKVRILTRRVTRSRSRAVTLRWKTRGTTAAVASYRVRAGRHLLNVRASGNTRSRARRKLHLKPGRYRWSVTALAADGTVLAKHRGKIRVKRPHRR